MCVSDAHYCGINQPYMIQIKYSQSNIQGCRSEGIGKKWDVKTIGTERSFALTEAFMKIQTGLLGYDALSIGK